MIKIGKRVRVVARPYVEGVVCEIVNGFAYVAWGDNNRQRFTFDEIEEISA